MLHDKGHLGPSVYCDLDMHEGQVVTFVFRELPSSTASKPTEAQAEVLGVPLEGTVSLKHCSLLVSYQLDPQSC